MQITKESIDDILAQLIGICEEPWNEAQIMNLYSESVEEFWDCRDARTPDRKVELAKFNMRGVYSEDLEHRRDLADLIHRFAIRANLAYDHGTESVNYEKAITVLIQAMKNVDIERKKQIQTFYQGINLTYRENKTESGGASRAAVFPNWEDCWRYINKYCLVDLCNNDYGKGKVYVILGSGIKDKKVNSFGLFIYSCTHTDRLGFLRRHLTYVEGNQDICGFYKFLKSGYLKEKLDLWLQAKFNVTKPGGFQSAANYAYLYDATQKFSGVHERVFVID